MNERRQSVTLLRISVLLLVLLLGTRVQAPAAGDSPEVVQAIRETGLDPSRAVELRGVTLDLGTALLEVDEGWLVPARPIDGRTLEMVFDGRGRFLIDPSDSIEAQQLELFTGYERLDVEIQQAVLFVGDESIARGLLDRPAAGPLPGEAAGRAAELFEHWIRNAERRGFGVEGAMFRLLSGDEPSKAHAAVWCRSEELGDFYYVFDPLADEQIVLGQFVAAEIDDVERFQIEKEIRKGRRQGRYTQLRVVDLGDWDTWISTALRDEAGNEMPGGSGFEPEHYTLEVEIGKRDERITGKARLDLRCESDHRRVVGLRLFEDLKVHAVRDDAGRDLDWFRVDEELLVVLAEPVHTGARLALEVEYSGVLFNEVEKGVFLLRDTYSWYPHAGSVDRAGYEATLRWPKGRQLFAGGRLVEGGESDGLRWQKRVIDLPSLAFSFEYGEFDVRTVQAGHVDLTVAFSKVHSDWDTGVKGEVVQTLTEALAFFEEKFGPYPLDELSVVTVPRDFSQGFLGFLTLSQFLVAFPPGGFYRAVFGESDQTRWEQRTETVAHELAHQWWGNMVGWHSYRDQWLSEALADYSATVFTASRAEKQPVYLARHGIRWRDSLNDRTKQGRTLESLGPVVLGERLVSSRSTRAYQAVVYDKGSVVFRMIARGLGPEPFLAMLGALSKAVAHRTIDTETFLAAMEKMSGVELGEFAERFVYGTGVPEIYYDYRFGPGSEGGWTIEGNARLIAQAHDTYRLLRDESGNWSLTRERGRSPDLSRHFLVVPFQIALRQDETDDRAASSRKRLVAEQTVKGLGGALRLQGETTRFSIPLDREPDRFWFDQRGEVLAEFYSMNERPKRMLRYQAMELPVAEAEATLHQALAAAYISEDALADSDLSRKELELQSRLEDARIYYLLARLYLDQDRVAEARQAFREAEDRIGPLDRGRFESRRVLIESRFDIRDGDFKSAYSRLSGYLRLKLPRQTDDTVFDSARRKKFRTGRVLSGDAYALLALSAHMTGHDLVARVALEEAEERGADMTALREALEAAAGG